MCRGDRFSYFPQLACKLVSTFDDGWRVCCVFLKEGCAMMFEGTGGGIAIMRDDLGRCQASGPSVVLVACMLFWLLVYVVVYLPTVNQGS
jgi:hypothetical protein